MNNFFKAALLAAAPIALAMPTLASAQAVSNVGVANLEEAVQKSNAFVLAINQIKITYKAQIDQVEARQKAINAELQPLVTAFQTAQKAPNPNQQALQTQYNAIQNKQQTGQQEIQKLGLPIARAQAYVEEQIVAKLDGALKSAMTKKKVTLVVAPQATISYQPGVDITNDIVTELNTAVPNASITPPANWQPGGQGQPAAAAATPAAQPKPATPGGR